MRRINFKRKAGLIFFFFFFTGMIVPAQDRDLWNRIKDTSWRYEDNWAGGIVTFFETVTGKRTAVWQICGSGVMVTVSLLYDVTIDNGALLFLDTAGQAAQQKPVYIYVFDETKSVLRPRKGMYPLVFLEGGPVVANKFQTIPLEELKRGDYSRLDLVP
jgi:hypothetical protein